MTLGCLRKDQRIRRLRNGSHLSTPSVHRYIGSARDGPSWSSMVNSDCISYKLHVATTVRRAPYSFIRDWIVSQPLSP